MPTVHEIEAALFRLAPRELAQPWDNVGLLVGRPNREVRRVLVALDITGDVVAEAEREQIDLIVAHHPIMNCAWRPVQTIRSDDIQGRKLIRLIEYDIAAICMHTNLDAAPGGVNDALAEALGLEEVEPLEEGDGIVRAGSLPEPMTVQRFWPGWRTVFSPTACGTWTAEGSSAGRLWAAAPAAGTSGRRRSGAATRLSPPM